MIAPELLAYLPEGDTKAERCDDIKRTELQTEPGKRRNRLENEPVDFDDRGE